MYMSYFYLEEISRSTLIGTVRKLCKVLAVYFKLLLEGCIIYAPIGRRFNVLFLNSHQYFSFKANLVSGSQS